MHLRFVALFGIGLALGGCNRKHTNRVGTQASSANKSDGVESFSAQALGGESIAVPSAEGETWLHIFATWDLASLADVAVLQEQMRKNPGRKVIGIVVDATPKEGALSWERAAAPGYPIIAWDDAKANLEPLLPNKQLTVPTTLVVRPDGKVLKVYQGPLQP